MCELIRRDDEPSSRRCDVFSVLPSQKFVSSVGSKLHLSRSRRRSAFIVTIVTRLRKKNLSHVPEHLPVIDRCSREPPADSPTRSRRRLHLRLITNAPLTTDVTSTCDCQLPSTDCHWSTVGIAQRSLSLVFCSITKTESTHARNIEVV